MRSIFSRLVHCCLLLPMLAASAYAIQPEDLLPPEQAFALEVRAVGPERLIAEWTIAEGYYLYRERTRFESEQSDVALGRVQFPDGVPITDEFFGDMEVYYHGASIPISLQRTADGSDRFELTVHTQGCAEVGVCYPPERRRIMVELPPLQVAAAATGPSNQSDLLSGLGIEPNRVPGAGSVPVGSASDSELLDPEKAFIPELTALDAGTLRATWQIDDCCYLYREQFAFEALASGVTLGEPRFPAGQVIEDEFFGRTETYRGAVSIDIPVQRASDAPERFEVQLGYQGCNDIGVCYMPQQTTLPVNLAGLPPATNDPAVRTTTSPSAAATPAVPVSEQDGIAQMLTEQRFWALPAFFGFGLLLAFTPCVFPMIPILSSLIAGHGNSLTRTRAFSLSLVYVLAMALTYTAAGVGAAMAGQNLQIWFQNPWVLGIFSGFFVLLALAMFGLFRLQIPSALQTRISKLGNRRGGSLVGVAVMGVLSALIVGPCVAPPLIGVLTVIGLTGDVTLGGSALFAMSLGMGAPLLLIGTSAGHWLPRAGAWMKAINAVFGVLLLAVAIWLLERILPATISMLLWAMLLIICAMYLGALKAGEGGWRTLARGFGVVMLVYGVLLLVGVAAGGSDVWQPLRGVLIAGSGPVQQQPEFRTIKTVADLEREIGAAGNRPVMLDFYADWCVSCKEMERYTFTDPGVQARLDRAVLLKADVTANDTDDRELLRHFNIIGPPAILFFDATGHEQTAFRVVGFMSAERFTSHLDRVLAQRISLKMD